MIRHCDGGGWAVLGAAAVCTGYKDVRDYYLSFSELAGDESCSIDRQ